MSQVATADVRCNESQQRALDRFIAANKELIDTTVDNDSLVPIRTLIPEMESFRRGLNHFLTWAKAPHGVSQGAADTEGEAPATTAEPPAPLPQTTVTAIATFEQLLDRSAKQWPLAKLPALWGMVAELVSVFLSLQELQEESKAFSADFPTVQSVWWTKRLPVVEWSDAIATKMLVLANASLATLQRERATVEPCIIETATVLATTAQGIDFCSPSAADGLVNICQCVSPIARGWQGFSPKAAAPLPASTASTTSSAGANAQPVVTADELNKRCCDATAGLLAAVNAVVDALPILLSLANDDVPRIYTAAAQAAAAVLRAYTISGPALRDQKAKMEAENLVLALGEFEEFKGVFKRELISEGVDFNTLAKVSTNIGETIRAL